jgi:hypothetical protein
LRAQGRRPSGSQRLQTFAPTQRWSKGSLERLRQVLSILFCPYVLATVAIIIDIA